jgi:alpha-galactosidase
MLMWHYDDTVESAALQFVATLYGVPQVSVKIARLSEEHRKMLEFYLSFWRENRDILIDGRLTAQNPESAYSIVCAEKDGRAIYTCYTDTLVDCSGLAGAVAVNSSRSKTLLIKGADKKTYKVLNCMGDTVSEGMVDGAICEIEAPLAGMIIVE